MADSQEKLNSEFKRTTYGTRKVFSYLIDLLKILQFSLLCNVVTSQRRNVGSSTPWNVATSVFPFFGTSRRWIPMSRHWLLLSLERRDVEPECRDVALGYCLEASHFWPYPHTHLHTPLSEPTVATSNHLAAAETTSLPLVTPVLPYSVPVSHIHHHVVAP